MPRRLLPMLLLLTAAVACAQDRHEIRLPHLTLTWDPASNLQVYADGQHLLKMQSPPVTAYPPGWAWSYAGRENIKTSLQRKGQQQVLTVTCADPKVPWTQTVTAGPGDKYTLSYRFRQVAWEGPMMYEVCAAQPTTIFVGGSWKAKGPWGEKAGVIPLQFEGASNPFGDATEAEFDILPGKFAFRSTVGLTLYDYPARSHLYLGRDAPMPQNEEQSWSVDFSFTPQTFVTKGIELSKVLVPTDLTSEAAEISLDLRQAAGGPDEVTVTWGERKEGATAEQRQVKLTDRPQTVRLSTKLPDAGSFPMGFSILAGQEVLYASPAFSVTVPRLLTVISARVPFMTDDEGALLVRVDPKAGEGLTLRVAGAGAELYRAPVRTGGQVTVPIALEKLPPGRVPLEVSLSKGNQRVFGVTHYLILAARKPNAVVIDNHSRTLIVNGLPFCPQSCYADMGSVDDVIETEPVFGFNTIAPYLSTSLADRSDRTRVRKMLDRCAQVGLYVQLAVHGVSRPPHTEEKWQWLKEEVEAFGDHPALLAYYLADEPELGWASAADCELAYNKLKELDPYHPITMVFCISEAAARYAKGMDICMTDPYPIPNWPVTYVSDFCDRINRDLAETMPLWVVPQSFGGGEGWRREPSRQEERVMTYLGLIHGGTGIQYFIRRPPAVNPNSPDLWSECRRLMLELSQLTPALAGERVLLDRVGASVPDARAPEDRRAYAAVDHGFHAAAFKERGAITVLVANVQNQPRTLDLAVPVNWSGQANVLFENRAVDVKQGKLTDIIDAMSTRAYRLQVQAPPPDLAALDPANLIVNPSWEEAANVGTPDGCYIGYNDRAASWYVDSRVAAHGRQSLRLRTPTDGQGIGVNPFPVVLKPGAKYALTIWARGEREGQQFVFSLDALKGEPATHALTTDWREYRVEFTSSEQAGRGSPHLSLLSAGSAWFDALQVVPL